MEIDNIRRDLECPLCLHPFTEPKFLPCFHTFCSKCLATLIGSNTNSRRITCPVCRAIHPVPLNKVFPPNFLVENFSAYLFSNSGSGANNNIKYCQECVEETLVYASCIDCQNLGLCEQHYEMHKMTRKTVGHRVKIIVEPKNLCPIHKGEPLKLFCKTCNCVICRDCAIKDHKNHNYDLKSDIITQNNKNALGQLEPLNNGFEEAIIKTQRAKVSLNDNAAIAVRSIQDYTNHLCRTLQIASNSLQLQVNQVYQNKQISLDKQESELNLIRADLQEHMTTIAANNNSPNLDSSKEFLEIKKKLAAKLASIPMPGAQSQYIIFEPNKQLTNTVAKIGRLRTGPKPVVNDVAFWDVNKRHSDISVYGKTAHQSKSGRFNTIMSKHSFLGQEEWFCEMEIVESSNLNLMFGVCGDDVNAQQADLFKTDSAALLYCSGTSFATGMMGQKNVVFCRWVGSAVKSRTALGGQRVRC
eukprot:TRINITY_DN11116_c0_g1_i2.p1 TRINITY_DN11116_c0_g1~~TRINITY_DN11116_c0_g1_i2.p1  ORF type:complete len:471 (-),score=48.57 TRINITY_DN11116_c0_g1_i2:9-1421(-)